MPRLIFDQYLVIKIIIAVIRLSIGIIGKSVTYGKFYILLVCVNYALDVFVTDRICPTLITYEE